MRLFKPLPDASIYTGRQFHGKARTGLARLASQLASVTADDVSRDVQPHAAARSALLQRLKEILRCGDAGSGIAKANHCLTGRQIDSDVQLAHFFGLDRAL